VEEIRQQISEACSSISIKLIAKRMGYVKVKKCNDRIQYVLSSPDLGLLKTNYDGLYSSGVFLDKLLEELGLGQLISSKELQDLRVIVANERWGFRPWISVGTQFNYNDVRSFALAIRGGDRRLELPKKLKMMARDKQLAFIRSFIAGYIDILNQEKKIISSLDKSVLEYLNQTIFSYADTPKDKKGIIPLWGKPVGFCCHLSENHMLKFDLDGNLLEDVKKDVDHGKATLSI